MDNKKVLANNVYHQVCAALDERKWKYAKEEDKNLVFFNVSGEDLPMRLLIVADEERQLLRLLSPLPFNMAEDKRAEGALATCLVSNRMANGNFDYTLSSGAITFRMANAFHDSLISIELIQYMISCALAMVDKYNDLFLALSKGLITIEQFIEKVQKN